MVITSKGIFLPLASKAFAGWERNVPLLAAHWRRINDATERFAIGTINGSRFIMDIDRGIDTSGVVAEECAQEDRNPFNWTDFNQIVLGTNRLEHKANGVSVQSHIDSQIHYISSCSRQENESYSVYKSVLTVNSHLFLKTNVAFGVLHSKHVAQQ